MGALVKNVCYVSQGEALDAFYSSAPSSVVSGETSYITQFQKIGGVWKASSYTVSSAGALELRHQVNAPIPTFPECDPAAGFVDGMTIGWMVATLFILVASVVALRRGAR